MNGVVCVEFKETNMTYVFVNMRFNVRINNNIKLMHRPIQYARVTLKHI